MDQNTQKVFTIAINRGIIRILLPYIICAAIGFGGGLLLDRFINRGYSGLDLREPESEAAITGIRAELERERANNEQLREYAQRYEDNFNGLRELIVAERGTLESLTDSNSRGTAASLGALEKARKIQELLANLLGVYRWIDDHPGDTSDSSSIK